MLILVPAAALSLAATTTTSPTITAGKVVPTVGVASWYDAGQRLTWPARGGTSGYHRMAGRLERPALEGESTLKQLCFANVERREAMQAALPGAIERIMRAPP